MFALAGTQPMPSPTAEEGPTLGAKTIVLVVILMIIAGASVMGILLAKKGSDNGRADASVGDNFPNKSSSPQPLPFDNITSASAEFDFETFVSLYLPSYSVGLATSAPDSPQRAALAWLNRTTSKQRSYDMYRLQQRYVVAILLSSANYVPEGELDSTLGLANDSECGWFAAYSIASFQDHKRTFVRNYLDEKVVYPLCDEENSHLLALPLGSFFNRTIPSEVELLTKLVVRSVLSGNKAP
jgi:hypothetical protein